MGLIVPCVIVIYVFDKISYEPVRPDRVVTTINENITFVHCRRRAYCINVGNVGRPIYARYSRLRCRFLYVIEWHACTNALYAKSIGKQVQIRLFKWMYLQRSKICTRRAAGRGGITEPSPGIAVRPGTTVDRVRVERGSSAIYCALCRGRFGPVRQVALPVTADDFKT